MYGFDVLCKCAILTIVCCVFFCQAEDGIRDLVRSRGLGDVYKRQHKFYVRDEAETSLAVRDEIVALVREALGFDADHDLSLIHI